jgi:hypothetical protein
LVNKLPLAFAGDKVNAILAEAGRTAVELGQNEDSFRTLVKGLGEARGYDGHVGGIPVRLASTEWWRHQNLSCKIK